MTVKVIGLENAHRNLFKEIKKIKGDVRKGLRAAGNFIKAKSVEITPALTGALRGSAFVSTEGGNNPKLRVGYTVSYAPIVHEMPETFNYSTPDTGPKFLEKAVTQNVRAILEIIKKRAQR